MNRLLILASLMLALCLASCDRSEKEKEKAQSAEPAKAHAEPTAFDRVAYRTSDGKSSITLTSPDDLEFLAPDGKSQACKYWPQDNTIHFRVGDQELVFERMPGELKAADGTRYLDASSQPDETTRARQQRALDEAEQQRLAEERRVETVVQESKKAKSEGRKFAVQDGGDGEYEIIVTDVSLRARQKTPPAGQTSVESPTDIWYGDLERIADGKSELAVSVLNGRGIHIRFKSQEQCNEVVAAIRAAFNTWRDQYPEAERRRVLLHGNAL